MPSRPNPLDTLLTALAGWLPMLGGMTLLAMVLITPEWMGWRELVWQRDVLKIQSERLETQRASYAQFNDALAADDPILLERLAFTQLRVKPAGKRLINDLWAIGGSGAVGPDGAATPGAGQAPDGQLYVGSDVIESWLAEPQPVVGRDIQPLRVIDSRLTRLTMRGPARYVLLTVAVLCLVAGLLPNDPEPDRQERPAVGLGGPAPQRSGPALRPDTRLSFMKAYRKGA